MANLTSPLGLNKRRYNGTAFLPELAAAGSLDLGARSVPRQGPTNGGLDLAKPAAVPASPLPPQSQAGPLPASPMASQQGQQPLLEPRQNPLGALGLVLGNTAAGMRGQPLPSDELGRQRLEERRVQMEEQQVKARSADLTQNVIERYLPILANADEKERAGIIDHAYKIFGGATGNDFRPLLTSLSGQGTAESTTTMAALKELKPSYEMLAYWGRHPEAAAKALAEYTAHKITEKPAETPEEAARKAGLIQTAQNNADIAAGKGTLTPDQERAKAKAQAQGRTEGENAAGGGPNAAKVTAQGNQLRGEFTNQSKPFVIVRDAYNNIKTAAKEPSAAGDVSLLFGYMKLLDPNSVVRESEFATAQNSAGVPDRIRALYNNALNGERLVDATRKDIVGTSTKLFDAATASHKSLRNEYGRLAKQQGINESDVIVDYLTPGGGQEDPLGIR